MMLWLARASRAGWVALAPAAADDDPDAFPAAAGAGAGAPAPAGAGRTRPAGRQVPSIRPRSGNGWPATRGPTGGDRARAGDNRRHDRAEGPQERPGGERTTQLSEDRAARAPGGHRPCRDAAADRAP